jgi:hypothetical protein
LAAGNGAATVYRDDGERAMPRSVPLLRRWRSASLGLTGCPTGKSGRRLTATLLRLGSQQRVDPCSKPMRFQLISEFPKSS